MSYVIGIDGGGTQTTGYIANNKQQILAKKQVGPTNYHSVGIRKVKDNLTKLIESLCSQQGITNQEISFVSLGIAGVDREEDKTLLNNALKQLKLDFDFAVNNDVRTALIGAHGEEKGIMAVSGTGSIVAGVNDSGQFIRVGGWGHLIGDEGSGYKIAIKMLERVMKAYDGRIDSTLLTDLVLEELGVDQPEEIIDYVYNPEISKENIAGLAPLVFEAVKKEDNAARQILDSTIEELLAMVETVISRLDLTPKEQIISLAGGVFENSKLLRSTFRNRAQNQMKDLSFRPAKFNPAIGALIIAWNKLGINYEEKTVFNQLETKNFN